MNYRIKCDQCCVAVINQVPCHEQGCPNESKPWTVDEADPFLITPNDSICYQITE